MKKNKTKNIIFLTLSGVLVSLLIWLSIKPFIAELYFRQGLVYMQQNQAKLAIPYFEKTISYADWEHFYWLHLGKAYKAARQLDAAEDVFLKLVKKDPLNPWYKLRLYETYRLQYYQKPQSAKQYVEKATFQIKAAAEVDHENPIFLLAYAHFLYQTKQFDKAASYYERIFEIDPITPEMRIAAYQLALIKLLQQDYDTAKTYLQHIFQIDPNYPGLRTAMAQIYFIEKKVDLDRSFLQDQLYQDPQHFKAREFLAYIHYSLDEWGPAIQQYTTLIEEKPKLFELYRIRALSFKGNGQVQEAIKSIQNFIKDNPDHRIAKEFLNTLKNG